MVYFTPKTLQEAVTLAGDSDAVLLAGGTDVYPSLQGRDVPAHLIDIAGLDELRGITRTGDTLRIGALTSWSDIRHASLPRAFDGLRNAAAEVGGIQIQNAGTIAGNLCNASPAADGVPPLLTLDASVELQSRRGRRVLRLEEFLQGPRATARAADEILTAIEIPELSADWRGSFEKLGSRRYLVISIAMAAALIRLAPDGRIQSARVAVGACAPVAKRLTELENDLVGQFPETASITPHHMAPLAPIDDPRGTAAYRAEAAVELCRRAVRSAGGTDG